MTVMKSLLVVGNSNERSVIKSSCFCYSMNIDHIKRKKKIKLPDGHHIFLWRSFIHTIVLRSAPSYLSVPEPLFHPLHGQHDFTLEEEELTSGLLNNVVGSDVRKIPFPL